MPNEDSDMYGEGDEATPAEDSAKPEGEGEPKPEGEEGESGQTALVPESLCPGMSAGDEIVVKIKSVLDGQYELSYSPEPKAKAPEKPSAPEKQGDPEMAEMMD
jgi:hypothetical protein